MYHVLDAGCLVCLYVAFPVWKIQGYVFSGSDEQLSRACLPFLGFLILFSCIGLVLYSDPIRSHRLRRAGFGQCLMAGPPRDALAHRCAAGNGLGGAAGDILLTGRIRIMEVLPTGGNYKSSGTSHKGQFWQLIQVIFPKSSLHLKRTIISAGHVSPPAPHVQGLSTVQC